MTAFWTMAYGQCLRNFSEFRKTWVTALFWSTLEPLFYLLAFGFGVGRLVGMVGEMAYAEFIVSGVILGAASIASYSEAGWMVFRKLQNKDAREYLLTTPLCHKEFIAGELAWASFRGLLTAFVLVGFSLISGLLSSSEAIRLLIVSALMAWIGASFGIAIGARVKGYNQVLLIQALALFPLIVMSGTFFPLELLPAGVRPLSFMLPLTHGNFLLRGFGTSVSQLSSWISALVLIGLAWASFLWARDGVWYHFNQNHSRRPHLRRTVP